HLLYPLPSPRPPSQLFPYTTLFRSTLSNASRSGLNHALRGLRTATCRHDSARRFFNPVFCNHLANSRASSAARCGSDVDSSTSRSEEHTSELQSRGHLVCRLLLEKK